VGLYALLSSLNPGPLARVTLITIRKPSSTSCSNRALLSPLNPELARPAVHTVFRVEIVSESIRTIVTSSYHCGSKTGTTAAGLTAASKLINGFAIHRLDCQRELTDNGEGWSDFRPLANRLNFLLLRPLDNREGRIQKWNSLLKLIGISARWRHFRERRWFDGQ